MAAKQKLNLKREKLGYLILSCNYLFLIYYQFENEIRIKNEVKVNDGFQKENIEDSCDDSLHLILFTFSVIMLLCNVCCREVDTGSQFLESGEFVIHSWNEDIELLKIRELKLKMKN